MNAVSVFHYKHELYCVVNDKFYVNVRGTSDSKEKIAEEKLSFLYKYIEKCLFMHYNNIRNIEIGG